MPLAVDIYDRRAEPEFVQRIDPVRLPSPDSMLSREVGRNILAAQMMRYQRLCTYAGYYARQVAHLLHRMVGMGYREGELWRTVEGHISQDAWRYGVSDGRLFALVWEFFYRLPRVRGCR